MTTADRPDSGQSSRDDWRLPEEGTAVPPPADGGSREIRLTKDELVVLDWVLCTGSGLMMPPDIQSLREWHPFRIRIWSHVYIMELNPDNYPFGILFAVEEDDAEILLLAVPTTMTWGKDTDSGFNLKLKLSRMLLGTYEDESAIFQREAEEKLDRETKEAADKKLASAKTAVMSAYQKFTAAKQASEDSVEEIATQISQLREELETKLQGVRIEVDKRIKEQEARSETFEGTIAVAEQELKKAVEDEKEAEKEVENANSTK